MYLGKSPTQKGYIMYDLETHNISVSRDVVFHENIFPLKLSTQPSNENILQFPSNQQNVLDPEGDHSEETSRGPTPPQEDETVTSEVPQQEITASEVLQQEAPKPPLTTRTARLIKKPDHLSDYFCSFNCH